MLSSPATGNPPLIVRPTADPPGVVFAEPPVDGEGKAIWVPASELERLARYFDATLRLAGDGVDVVARLAAAVEALTERGDLRAGPTWRIDDHCRRAAVPSERWQIDGPAHRQIFRNAPLFQTTEVNGYLRTMSIRVSPAPGGNFDVVLTENFADPGGGGFHHELSFAYRSLVALADLVGPRVGDLPEALPDRAVALFTGLVAGGELGPHLAPDANTRLVIGWCREVDASFSLGGRCRSHEILGAERTGDQAALVLAVSWPFPYDAPPVIRFTEGYRTGEELRPGDTTYAVTVPLDGIATLVEHAERELGLAPAPGWWDDRLIACLDALAERGELAAGLPHQANRARLAALVRDAGLQPTVTGFNRREKLLAVHRPATNCRFELSLVLDEQARADKGIRFAEDYDYYPQAGDPGREYGYHVYAPYEALERLVAYFERLLAVAAPPPPATLDDRLVACFRALVARGELTGEMPLQAAAERVDGWFAEAGAPHRRDTWVWIDS
jgi:hypothetical protein